MADMRIAARRKENPFINQICLAHDLILEDIATGVIAAGSKIQPERLAKQFDMSRSPVREALMQLAEERYVQLDANGSFYACQDDVIDYFEYWLFRVNLEQFSAYHAARNICPEQMARLRQNVKCSELCAKEHDVSGFLKADEEFHRLIAEASGNRYVLQWLEDNLQRMTLYRYRFANLGIVFDYSLQKHKKILKAVIDHDDELAQETMRLHLEVARMRGLSQLTGVHGLISETDR